jgi:putative PIN family toxin of toxin-antitoxin system
MLKVVPDTNVLVSAATHVGKPRERVDFALNGEVTLLVSMEILSEFKKDIAREKFKLSQSQQAVFIEFVSGLTSVVDVRSKFKAARDPKDNIVPNCAYDGRADYIVSGDRDLLALGEFKEIKIVSVDEILTILKRQDK